MFTGSAKAVRWWVVLGVLAPLGMLLLSAVMLTILRADVWERARQTAGNLLQLVASDVGRNVEIIDLSLSSMVSRLKLPAVVAATPELRQIILFDRAASARDIGSILVLDRHGDTVLDAASIPPRQLNFADRRYFQIHREQPDRGLFISRPLTSRISGARLIVLSRRLAADDGDFDGIVVGTLRLTHFTRAFDRLGLGPGGVISLIRLDGMQLMRHPATASNDGGTIAGTPLLKRLQAAESGQFVMPDADGVEHYVAFRRIGDLPLILTVALPVDGIEAGWRHQALVIGAVVLLLGTLSAGLVLLFTRELARRSTAEAELARLSLTDALTGLPNRRRFDAALEVAWAQACRDGAPLALLIIDADHFKRINDRYGHQVGDEVLAGLAQCLARSARRPSDLACRLGGEEFAILLPGVEGPGAGAVAASVHAEVAQFALPAAGVEPGAVTVSIGAAVARPGLPPATVPARLYGAADAALYRAKASGRNRTEIAGEAAPDPRQEMQRVA
ncbi:sensor domain-containing diguanylate cyclase [Methylobacterium sp. ID0610]|uniref:sensor domain-containing diguanylate cyclase n=1 Tax=Methylobacterium carpenticola TaxID=3344827 RepID=UPI0036AD51D5